MCGDVAESTASLLSSSRMTGASIGNARRTVKIEKSPDMRAHLMGTSVDCAIRFLLFRAPMAKRQSCRMKETPLGALARERGCSDHGPQGRIRSRSGLGQPDDIYAHDGTFLGVGHARVGKAVPRGNRQVSRSSAHGHCRHARHEDSPSQYRQHHGRRDRLRARARRGAVRALVGRHGSAPSGTSRRAAQLPLRHRHGRRNLDPRSEKSRRGSQRQDRRRLFGAIDPPRRGTVRGLRNAQSPLQHVVTSAPSFASGAATGQPWPARPPMRMQKDVREHRCPAPCTRNRRRRRPYRRCPP